MERRPEFCWGVEHPEYSSDQRIRQDRVGFSLEEPNMPKSKTELAARVAGRRSPIPRRPIDAKPGTRAGNFVARRYRVHPAFARSGCRVGGPRTGDGPMTDMLRVILRPAFTRRSARLHGKFVVTLDGRQLCISRQPLLDAARILIKEGIDPATPIATRHAGAGFDAMISTVGAAAKWTVRENEIQSPTLVPWKPFPGVRVQAPIRFDERPVP
jgi:hypothetical protein